MAFARVRLAAVLPIVIALAAGPAKEDAEVMLQAAIQRELATGDLSAAVEAYKRVVALAAGTGVAAKALVRLGACYERIGDRQARAAYERVVREYPNEKDQVAVARRRLARLRTPLAPNGIVVRQVWTGPQAELARTPSPDGRYFAYTERSTGDLAIRDMSTGERRLVTRGGTTGGRALSALFSDNGKQLAYTWYQKDFELRTIRVDGSGERTLLRESDGGVAWPVGWMPDGVTMIALVEPKEPVVRLVALPADGPMRVIREFPIPEMPWEMSLSDLGLMVYSAARAGSADVDLFLLSVQPGAEPSPLLSHPAMDHMPVWAPGGNRVVFVSDRGGSEGLWAIDVKNGKPEGSPVLLKPDVGKIRTIGFTDQGSYYYSVQTGTRDVYTAEIEGGKLSSRPARVEGRMVGTNMGPSWSPDGEFLLYHSFRVQGVDKEAPGQALVIRSMRTGAERTLYPKIQIGAPAEWFPDGRTLLLRGCERQGNREMSFYRLDTETANLTLIRRAARNVMYARAGVSPNAPRVFGWTDDGKGRTAIVSEDLDTGRQAEIYRGTGTGSIKLSPNGKLLAFLECGVLSRALRIMPVEGGKPFRNIEMAPPLIPSSELAWSPDSSYIVLARSTGQTCRTELWKVAVDRGGLERMSDEMNCIAYPGISPDGRRIAFGSGVPAARKTEIWMMENLLKPGGDQERGN